MKKQIFNLMVGTVLLTSNAVFAMEPQDENPKLRISVSPKQGNEDEKKLDILCTAPKPSNWKTLDIHECTSCNSKLRFTDTNKTHGKGDLNSLPEEVILIPFKHSGINDLLSLSMTSKEMYNFCQNPLFWTNFAEREHLEVNTKSCIKEQVKGDHIEYLKLFERPRRANLGYFVRTYQLINFIKNPCMRTWLPTAAYKDYHHTQSYQFAIGKRKFELFAWHPAVASSSYLPSSTVHERLVSTISKPREKMMPREEKTLYESFSFASGPDEQSRLGYVLSIDGCSLSIMELEPEQL